MRTIKEEEVDLSEYADFADARRQIGRFADARRQIGRFIDAVYNLKRIDSLLRRPCAFPQFGMSVYC
jgi:hypothetical protein